MKAKPKQTIAFDPQHPDNDEARFAMRDWHKFNHDAAEPIPRDAPEPRGDVVLNHCFVDADHAGNRLTRRSQTGTLLFICRAIVLHTRLICGQVNTVRGDRMSLYGTSACGMYCTGSNYG